MNNKLINNFMNIYNKIEKDYLFTSKEVLKEYVYYSLTELGYKINYNIDRNKIIYFNEMLKLHNEIINFEYFDLLGYIFMGGHTKANKGYKGNKNLGQFFTSSDITSFIAEKNLMKLYNIYIDEKEYYCPIKILEPAAGTGSMIISLKEKIEEINLKTKFPIIIDNFEFTTIELNKFTAKCLLLQMHLLNINCVVKNGNYIKDEIYEEWTLIKDKKIDKKDIA